MVALDEITDPEERALADRAGAYLLAHSWCRSLRGGRLAYAVAGVVGVFDLDLEPAGAGVDSRLWVVVGDLPSAYLVRDDATTWREALAVYVELMRDWVEAIRTGGDLSAVYPVEAAPTAEHAEMLAGRLDFLERHLLTPEVPWGS